MEGCGSRKIEEEDVGGKLQNVKQKLKYFIECVEHAFGSGYVKKGAERST